MGKTIEYTFDNNEGETLAGKLELPDGPPKAFAIFVHCFTGSKEFSVSRQISRGLRDKGFGVLRFDFTGHGNSEGDFGDTTFSSNIEDIKSAFNSLKETYDAPQIIIGHSLGGAAVLASAPFFKDIKAVITIGAPSSTEHLTHHFEEHLDDIKMIGRKEVQISGRSFTISKEFVADLKGDKVLTEVEKMKKALLIFHSPQDETVSIDHARKIYQNAKHPKSFISLPNADHLLTNKQDALYVAHIIAEWCTRYISKAKIDTDQDEKEAA